ncbi:MAG: DUF2273 domain-containing protein [Clostridiales bacterium]|nr:DUF2273 domain-containing protein [Clostridiales bacterium]
MDELELLVNLWRNHKGKIIGMFLGLLFAIFIILISMGFFQALFICLCIAVGFYLGMRIDSKFNKRLSGSGDELFDSWENK